jgi:glycosyltransferase involved in cell wall biosynthesis
MNVVAVIPAYNAERHIRDVLRRVAGLGSVGLGQIIVVDDGSRDDTARYVRDTDIGDIRLTLHQRTTNGGYGAAMKDGLGLARQAGAEFVACIHADGQYAPEALPGLLRHILEARLDLVQGSRIAPGTALEGGMPRYKYIANALLNVVENRTLGLGLTDYHSGYLVYGPRALTLPFELLSDSFDFDLEVIASARAHGFDVGEAPIPTHYGDEVSHLNPLTYGLRVLRVMWNFRRGRYGVV